MFDKHLIPEFRPLANEKQVHIDGKYRFTVIAPELLRVEVDKKGEFSDHATQQVWFRDLGECKYGVQTTAKTIEIITEKATYVFDKRKERVTQVLLDGEYLPCDNSDNLMGTARTLDMTAGHVKMDKGVIGKKGVAVMDDNSLYILDNGEIAPRNKGKDSYIFASKDYRRTLKLFYDITGKQALVPRYALGNWWSRYHAYTQQGYLDLMDRFIEEDIPFTIATIDMDWHWVKVNKRFGYKSFKEGSKKTGKYLSWPGWTGYSWNTELFPDYKAFLNELKDKNLKITMNLHPASGVRWFENQYEEMAEALGHDTSKKKTINFDITNTDFMNAYFKYLHKPYEEDGVAFWWIDWQQGKQSGLKGYDPLWACNHFHYLDNAKGGNRPLILSRYAGLGSHRYPLGFSGDTLVVWPSLKFQPYFTANAANCGYTTWSHDIGGHQLGSPENDELYLRWIQFGVYSPIMRLHSSSINLSKEPWNHKSVEKQTKEQLRFRHRLIPYIYTAYYLNYRDGRAICEPMYYAHPDKEEAFNVPNEYHFGSELIVAPITSPMDKDGKAKVEVWLPEGEYTDIYTGEKLQGGKHIVTRDINSIPVFAKSGAIIPMSNVHTGNDSSNPTGFEILAFVGQGEYTLYEDDGISMKYQDGDIATTTFKMNVLEDGYSFVKENVQGNVALIPELRSYKVVFDVDVKEAKAFINGEEYACDKDGNTVTVTNIKPSDRLEIIIK